MRDEHVDFQQIYEEYRPRLEQVEQILKERARSNQAELTSAGEQLLEAGGKRIRPLFALICGTVGENVSDDVAKIAAALEMTHMATLVHDDVIDQAALRRGRPTVRSAFGNLAAMYTGDYLFARAIQLLAEVDNQEVHRAMANGIVKMCQGEIEQIQDFYNWSQGFKTYFRRIQRKTALLIALSCGLGALVGGGRNEEVHALRRFGYYTGMAFQVIDDVLDFTGSAEVVGKPVGGDLRQGNITLPALLALRNPGLAKRLQELVHPAMSAREATEAIDLIVGSGALGEAKRVADWYIAKALLALQAVSRVSVRQQLTTLTLFLADRTF
ncbi:heptaprenyl diphosphate synthase [Alicyclobacillus hesperidum]|uniref:Heptaprenyl diphosphate synthase n=1 Tax=Alicyclobacillus hesperidum TaxID=89784 RepID=A0A1H2XT68_9BACL|nr:heptaprenyl diphosphate synthase [Alicyclobacillus hesperidum]